MNACPRCKRELVYNPRAGVSLCPDWQHWTTKPTEPIPEGADPFTVERDALAQKIMDACDDSIPFMRDACLVAGDKSVNDIFAGVALACIDAFVQEYEGRLSGVTSPDERRSWMYAQLQAVTEFVIRERVGKMEPPPVPKARMN